MGDIKGLDLPKNVTKFLVLSDNAKYLRYVFGRNGLYVESIISIFTDSSRGQFQRPTIILAQYDHEEQVRLLMLDDRLDRLQIRRIFKSVWKRPKAKDKIDGFISNCAKNALHLASGKTFRIYCKDSAELQKRFYDTFLKMNEQEKTECKFDFDEYDVLLWIKAYDAADKYWLITGLEGIETPASSNS